MVAVNKIVDKEEIGIPKVDESARNLIIYMQNKRVNIKIHPREAQNIELTKDQAILVGHMLLARARLIEE